ncbi:MAG: restriction endonuclease subunit S [Clostridia bacterium]|nr:restriction endonuclease subunit S [Clostridia bacterium]
MRVKLGEIVGKTISGEWGNDDEFGTGIPVLRTTNFTNDGIINYEKVVTRDIQKKKIDEKYLRYGDIIIEKSGGSDKQPVGRVVFFEGEEHTYLFNNFTGVLRVNDATKWNSRYVFYSLYANYLSGGTIRYQNKTTGLHNLKTEQYVSEFEVQYRELSEQKNICELLDKVSDLIAIRKKQLQKLDDLVKARFVEMFGDLANPACNWLQIRLADACMDPDDIKCGPFGTQLSKEEYRDSGVAVWEIPQINSHFVTKPSHYLTEEKAKQLDAYSLKPGDIAMSRKGNVGKCAIFPTRFEAGIIHSDVLRIRVDDSRVSPLFMMHQLHYSGAVQHQIELVSSGAIMAGINVTKLKQIFVHIPPLELQIQFATFVEQTDKPKSTIQQSLDKLELLKKALMQKYFG